jgi:hypothetical protein
LPPWLPPALGSSAPGSSSTIQLHRQSFSAFGPATIDHPTPRFGRHPFSKSVGPGTFYSARLIGAFHCLASLFQIEGYPMMLIPIVESGSLTTRKKLCQGANRSVSSATDPSGPLTTGRRTFQSSLT